MTGGPLEVNHPMSYGYSQPLRRSMRDCTIAGVCGGIAEYFDLDSTLVRVVYVLASICTAFSGVWIYIILWILIPKREYY